MAHLNGKVTVDRLLAGTTLSVTVYTTRTLRFRLWLAMRLIGLVAWILQCDVIVDMMETQWHSPTT